MKNISALHFDTIAQQYEFWKKKNWYYYEALTNILTAIIPKGKTVMEIGCGLGTLLYAVQPKSGLGVDPSKQMIMLANKKNRNNHIRFKKGYAETFSVKGNFDVIFMADVIEHLYDSKQAFRNIAAHMEKKTVFINSMANPLWEPILTLAEKIGLKMPEGSHKRISVSYMLEIAKKSNLCCTKIEYFLPFPFYIPLFSNFANRVIKNIYFIKKIGFIVVMEFRKVKI